MPLNRLALGLFVALLLVAAHGCGGGSDGGPVPVTGTVTVDGKPLDEYIKTEGRTDLGTVQFIPVTGTSTSFGRIDPSGDFELSTHEPGDGALPGEYNVAVTIHATPVGADEKTKALSLPTPFAPTAKYASPETSGLKVTVSEDSDQNTFNFDLKTDSGGSATP